jgi:hypothetical protein
VRKPLEWELCRQRREKPSEKKKNWKNKYLKKNPFRVDMRPCLSVYTHTESSRRQFIHYTVFTFVFFSI